MKKYTILWIVLAILIVVINIIVIVNYWNTPVSELPAWVFWLKDK